MEPKNLLIIMSDQHSRDCWAATATIVQTPNLDRLAARGTLFTTARRPLRCACRHEPPSRPASTCIRSAPGTTPIAYDGAIPSWHHRLREPATGGLDRQAALPQRGDDSGFSEAIIRHAHRRRKGRSAGPVPARTCPSAAAPTRWRKMAGPGESMYTTYDREIAARAQSLAARRGAKAHRQALGAIRLVRCPHFPLTAPPEHFYRYFDDQNLPMPQASTRRRNEPDASVIRDYRQAFDYDDFFERPEDVSAPRPAITACAASWTRGRQSARCAAGIRA